VDRTSLNATTDPAYSWASRLPRSLSMTSAKPFHSRTPSSPYQGQASRSPLTFTSRPSEDLAGAAAEGMGQAKGSSPPSPTSSGDTGASPPRRTSGRITLSPAMQRCGADSGASPQRSSLQAPRAVKRLRGRRTWTYLESSQSGPSGVLGVPRLPSEICRRSVGDPSEIAHLRTRVRPTDYHRPPANQARRTVCHASQLCEG
jgi:hypothetical protein